MRTWRLTVEELTSWLGSLSASGRRVVAPADEDGIRVFADVAPGTAVELPERGRTQLSAKAFFLPPSEALFTYRIGGSGVEIEEAPEPDGTVVVGLRPCDAAGCARLEDMLGGDGTYARRRERTVLVSVACNEAEASCFCTAVGGSPAGTEGADVLLDRLDGSWLLTSLTRRGDELVGEGADWRAASGDDLAAADRRHRAVEESISAPAVAESWARVLSDRFGARIWTELGERCLGCGVCAYVCPSCSCFDVSDTGSATCGVRCRSWDSCGFALFTKHASGHNPRAHQFERLRQRVLHKFSWFPIEHGRLMCVGCGRCTELCPVGIDVRAIVEAAAAGEPADAIVGVAPVAEPVDATVGAQVAS